MADATLISKGSITPGSSMKEYSFTIPSIPAGGVSDEYSLPLDVLGGSIHGLRVVAPLSGDFDFSLRNKAGSSPPSVNEILKVIDVTDGDYSAYGLGIPFRNADSPQTQNLYARVTNTDVSETGPVEISLQIQ